MFETQTYDAIQTNEFWRNLPMLPQTEVTPHATRHNGFGWLRRNNKKLYNAWTTHLKTSIDKFDPGFKGYGGAVPHFNDLPNLNFWRDSRNEIYHKTNRRLNYKAHLTQLSLRDIEAHSLGKDTFYYVSKPFGGNAVLMLDTDDKAGAAGPEDVQAVNKYLHELFPNHYDQVSTGGKGWHGYLVLKYSISSEKLRIFAKELEDALQTEIHSRFRCTFELKGLPTILNRFGGYKKCGIFAKIPRLPTENDIADYLGRPTFSLSQLEAVLARLKASHTASFPSSGIDMDTSISEPKTPVSISMSERKGKAVVRGYATDPCTRMNQCGWYLSLELKRAATEDEIWDRYHLEALNTGDDLDGNRRRLCKEAASWCGQHYDPHKQAAFDLRATVALIDAHTTPEMKKAAKRRSRYRFTSEQLAVVLHVMERSSLTRHSGEKLQYTVPNNSIISMMEKLSIQLEGNPEVQRKRLSPMKIALVEAGLAEVVNPNWFKGIGKKYGLGPKHPKYQEYLTMKNLLLPEPIEGIVRLTGR